MSGIPKIDLRLGDNLDVMSSMLSNSIDLFVFSPPYNCRKEYVNFSDQMAWDDYYAWMGKILDECYRLLRVGGTIAVNVPGVIKWQREHQFNHTWSDYDPTYKNHRGNEKWTGKGRIEPVGFRVFEMMRERDKHTREPIIWVKGSEGNAIAAGYQCGCDSDPFLRATHEFILLGSKGRWFHRGGTGRRGVEAMPHLDYTKDVWFVSPESSAEHPAPFPKEIPARLISLFCHATDAVVCDIFCGIGNSGIASIEAGKSFIGIDNAKEYLAIAEKRIGNARVAAATSRGESAEKKLSDSVTQESIF